MIYQHSVQHGVFIKSFLRCGIAEFILECTANLPSPSFAALAFKPSKALTVDALSSVVVDSAMLPADIICKETRIQYRYQQNDSNKVNTG